MSQVDRLEVIDRETWRKQYSLEKSIIYIGSASSNDVVLETERGTGAMPRHVQLIAADHGAGYQLINLTNNEIYMGMDDDNVLAPHGVTTISDGNTFRIGEFTLILHAGSSAVASAVTGSSRQIGLSLSLPQTQLAPHQSLEGVVRVQNLGAKTGVQFELDVFGLEPEYYDLEPGPLLPAGAEKEVFFCLYHRGDGPPAGDLQFTIHATAPRAYMGAQATVSQVIQVLPDYKYELKVLKPNETGPPNQPNNESSSQTQQQPIESSPATQPKDGMAGWSMPKQRSDQPATSTVTIKAKTTSPVVAAAGAAATNQTDNELWTTPSVSSPVAPPPSSPVEASAEAANVWGGASEAGPAPPLAAAKQFAQNETPSPFPAKAPPQPEQMLFKQPRIAADVEVQSRVQERLASSEMQPEAESIPQMEPPIEPATAVTEGLNQPTSVDKPGPVAIEKRQPLPTEEEPITENTSWWSRLWPFPRQTAQTSPVELAEVKQTSIMEQPAPTETKDISQELPTSESSDELSSHPIVEPHLTPSSVETNQEAPSVPIEPVTMADEETTKRDVAVEDSGVTEEVEPVVPTEPEAMANLEPTEHPPEVEQIIEPPVDSAPVEPVEVEPPEAAREVTPEDTLPQMDEELTAQPETQIGDTDEIDSTEDSSLQTEATPVSEANVEDDEWSAAFEESTTGAKILEMKASSAQPQSQDVTADTDLPSEIEDWWTAEPAENQSVETDNTPVSESQKNNTS